MSEKKTTIEYITPQFGREDDVEPDEPPEDFEALHEMSEDELDALGMRKWDDGLYLFPYQWYDDIPEGFGVVTINGDEQRFYAGETDDDRRFGALPYGIRTGEV